MDLIFKRYANPYLLIDEMLEIGQFSDFIFEVIKMKDEDEQWEFFLHKVMNQSFAGFKNSMVINNKQITMNEIETTVNNSYSILEILVGIVSFLN